MAACLPTLLPWPRSSLRQPMFHAILSSPSCQRSCYAPMARGSVSAPILSSPPQLCDLRMGVVHGGGKRCLALVVFFVQVRVGGQKNFYCGSVVGLSCPDESSVAPMISCVHICPSS